MVILQLFVRNAFNWDNDKYGYFGAFRFVIMIIGKIFLGRICTYTGYSVLTYIHTDQ